MPHVAQPSRLKICHVVATTEGASWVFEQLRGLRDRHGDDVAVVLNGASGALVDRFRAEAIPVHVADFDFTSSPDLVGLPRKVLALARLLRRERFDVVQTSCQASACATGSAPLMMIRLRNRRYALRAMPRMWLYRGYALLGRSASFGLRGKLASFRARAVIRLRNAWCGLRAMPRMLVYRCYGTASRGARALGLRRTRPIGTLRTERTL